VNDVSFMQVVETSKDLLHNAFHLRATTKQYQLPPSWIFEIAKFYWLLWRRGSRHISMPNVVKIGQSVANILRFFRFFKMAAAAILDCRNHKILLADHVRRAQTHHCTKFHQNRSFYCGDIAILQIFKMAATTILDFLNREILLAAVVERVQTHQHAKCCQNR